MIRPCLPLLFLATAATVLLLTTSIPCQPPPTTPLQADYANLVRTDRPRSVKERLRLLRAFLDRHRPPADNEGHVLVLKARLRLGRLLLVSFACTEATQELQRVVDLAQAPRYRDLRGRALYGIAQAQEMLRQGEACRAILKQLQDEFEDTRYGRIAAIAARRLENASGRARNGVAAPAFGPLLDLDGRLVSDGALRLKPALLLFWSPDVDSSVKRVERLVRTWRQGGGDPQQVVALAVHPDRKRVAAVAKKANWAVSVVSCGSDFLDPVVLAYGVDGVPTTFVVGPDGTLLGRDQGAQEIARLLQTLR